MTKQQVTIEVDVPDGWEAIDYRAAKRGEVYLANGQVLDAVTSTGGQYIIIRKAWQWPSWLKAEWIAMSASGEWYAFNIEPSMLTGAHWTSGNFQLIDLDYYDFQPPPCTDWRTSKRRRPT